MSSYNVALNPHAEFLTQYYRTKRACQLYLIQYGSPSTDSAIYIVNVTDGTNGCSDSVAVYIEQPLFKLQ